MMRFFLLFIGILFLSIAPVSAQSTVTAVGPITPGDCAQFNSTTVIKDAGTTCGGGGSGSPGGASGQIQYNNAGSFGGFTMGGDCTVTTSTGIEICTKTNGVAFGLFATIQFTPINPGDIIYWNGTIWTNFPGNTGAPASFTESSTGVPSWVPTSAGGGALPQAVPGGRLVLQMSNGIPGGIPRADTTALATKSIVLSCGTVTWQVPLDFTATNTLTAVAPTGGGGGSISAAGSTGSGGAGWSESFNQTFTPGSTVTVSIPCGGSPGIGAASGGSVANVWLCTTLVTNCGSILGTAVVVGACAGAPGIAPGSSAALGGLASCGVALGPGAAKFSGGNSGIGGGTSSAGGGGSGGPSGNGGNGANGISGTGGAGGTGDGGVVAGGAANSPGIPATLGTDSITGKVATVSSGGGGASNGGTAGTCGGMGGGVGGGANASNGATGCPAGIIITYTPSPSIITYSPCGTYVSGCASPFVPYYNGTNMALGAFTSGLNDATGLTLTLSVTNNTAGNCYEIFYFNNAGAPTIGTGPALTSCTPSSFARAATGGLATVGSIQANATASMTINNGASSFTCPQYQCTVLGMIHTPVNAQVPMLIKPGAVVGGPNSELGLDNYYNQIPIRAIGHDATSSWSYNITTARSANNSANNAISILDGLGAKQNVYGYYTSLTGPSVWAGTPELTLNQTCATGISGGAGNGALVVQGAGGTSTDGTPAMTFYSPYPIAGLTKMTACDGTTNATLSVFGNDFMQYYIDTRD